VEAILSLKKRVMEEEEEEEEGTLPKCLNTPCNFHDN
jgi:hypothetical protein